MKKIVVFAILLCLSLTQGCTEKEFLLNFISKDTQENNYDVIMKRDILCLMMAYPGYITNIEQSINGNVYIVMKSGKKILYDDKRKKNYYEKLNNPDLQDMMEQIYPLSDIENLMDKDFDPGRIRVYALLREVYGESKAEVESNLINIKIGYKYYPFNRNNNAAEALKKVVDELVLLMPKKPEIYPFVMPISGTFNYRYISGTGRLSPHSFGIAVDLARDKRDYWKWASQEQGQTRLSEYPREIVQIFEKNNFIWGGKWGHFDILHFEYRPELILKSRYYIDKLYRNRPWYDGFPFKDKNIKNYIRLIDEGLK